MVGGLLLSAAVVGCSLAAAPGNWPLWLPLALLWLASPALALWVSRERGITRQENIAAADKRALRLTARRTWRF